MAGYRPFLPHQAAAPAAILALCIGTPGHSAVLESSDTHYRLAHEASTPLAPAALWERLVNPSRWWNPLHSFSGEADNLHLDAHAGGLWREDWEGGSVAHGRVLQVRDGELLRLEAPFGPLQGIGAYVIWTITLTPGEHGGSTVTFQEVATAPPGSGLDKLAGAVDGVKAEALARLAGD
jgi:uncharacterized protein YndB with AHSA1/START domain